MIEWIVGTFGGLAILGLIIFLCNLGSGKDGPDIDNTGPGGWGAQ